MYQALYRKWRPLVFSDVIGQSHVTDTLKGQVRSGNLSHAYLFTGTRGTGKTTCAKILARVANCTDIQDGDPCNQCTACRGVLSGNILDVTEIDAASNNGVDNIREIREEVRYTPSNVQKRVYIIDEVHMLSAGAFNALLKTLEEPPAHVLFILATTEIHKVPATILSRCQRFDFHRISQEEIAKQLQMIAQKEEIEITPEAAMLLARLADGSLRDALSLLERIAIDRNKLVDETVVTGGIGILTQTAMETLMRAIANKDVPSVLEQFSKIYIQGKEPTHVFAQLLELIRDLLLVQTIGDRAKELASPLYAYQTLQEISQAFTQEELIKAATVLQQSMSRMSRIPNKRIEAEVCLVRLCEQENVAQQPVVRSTIIAKAEEPRVKIDELVKPEMDAPPWEETQEEKQQDMKPATVQNNYIEKNPELTQETKQTVEQREPETPIAQDSKEETFEVLLKQLDKYLGKAAYINLKQFAKGRITDSKIQIKAEDFLTFTLLSDIKNKSAISRAAEELFGRPFVTIVSEEEEETEEKTSSAELDKIIKRAQEMNVEIRQNPGQE